MLLDLLSLDNYVSYNIKVADILGLHAAIYLSELMNINDKAVKKSKTKDNYFTVDRKYITSRTTLSIDEQVKIDEQFRELGLLKIGENSKDELVLDIGVLTSILAGDDTILVDLKKLVKSSKTKNRATKTQQLCEQMKTYIKTNNTELYSAYCDWIDAVYTKLGWMSKKAVEVGERMVDETSNHDLDVALKILEIATVNGYKDMTWAVDMYNRNYRPTYSIKSVTKPQPRSTGVGEEVF